LIGINLGCHLSLMTFHSLLTFTSPFILSWFVSISFLIASRNSVTRSILAT
jgi:hypothetical protein